MAITGSGSAAASSPAPGAEGVTAAVVAAVDSAWAAIRSRHGDVPAVVLTLGSGTLGATRARERLGHFAAGRWQPAASDAGEDGTAAGGTWAELFIAGEGLRLGAEELLGTLLHEAAHAIAHTRGIIDTSRQGRYHNARYRTLALEVGLQVAEVAPHGWAHTTVPSPTLNAYAGELEQLRTALLAWRHPERTARGATSTPGPAGHGEAGGPSAAADTGQDPAGQAKNGVVARCGCLPRPRQFRITSSVLAAGPIVCGICAQPFTTAPMPT